MDIKPVTGSFSVADQVTLADLLTLKTAGYRTLICNRPDAEAAGQPSAAELSVRAQELGLSWHWLPIIPGEFSAASVAQFGDLLAQEQAPILAFCRTGTRAITLWALAQARQQPVAQVLQQAAAAGYDLSAMASRLDAARQG